MMKYLLFLISLSVYAQNEQHYINKYCSENLAYTATVAVDCLTAEYAIEFDFSHKWAEAIGQSLYYALQTNKKPAIFIICKNHLCNKHLHKLNTTIAHYQLQIQVFHGS